MSNNVNITFDDQPIVNLLEKSPDEMSQEELQAYVTRLRNITSISRDERAIKRKSTTPAAKTNEAKTQSLLDGLDL